jgi:hypothetical protein
MKHVKVFSCLSATLFTVLAVSVYGGNRPADIAFKVSMIDPGSVETCTVADINRDGKLDIVAGESWYEAPSWVKHPIRQIGYQQGYIDNFADIAMDVDGDGWVDIIQFSYFAHEIVWLKNPGRSGAPWKGTQIDNSGPTEFAFLVDLNNDGKAQELLPEFDRADVPAAWFELVSGKWVKHVVADKSYGHGIGVGDMNSDGRNDILTPKGWLEAPADIRAAGYWKFHPTDWGWKYIPPAGTPAAEVKPSPAAARAGAQFGYMYLLDVNGDGRKDVLTGMAHDYGLAWYEQMADGSWTQHVIDASWSQLHDSHLVDINGDGRPDFVTGKRYFAHNGSDPGERDPLGIYWYEWHNAATATPANGGVEWTRHIIDYSSRMGAGVQSTVADIDGDGDLDIIAAGKSGLFIAQNLAKKAASK